MDLPPSFSQEFNEQTRLVLAAYLASTADIIITGAKAQDYPIIFATRLSKK